MAMVILDAKKWANKISSSRGLRPLLENVPFLEATIDDVFTLYHGKIPGTCHIISGLMSVLQVDERVMRSVRRITNDSTERNGLLLWFAFEVYSAAKEQNVLPPRSSWMS